MADLRRPVSNETLIEVLLHYARHSASIAAITQQRRFRSVFGVTPCACNYLWYHADRQLPSGIQTRYFVIGLVFLRNQVTENVLSVFVG